MKIFSWTLIIGALSRSLNEVSIQYTYLNICRIEIHEWVGRLPYKSNFGFNFKPQWIFKYHDSFFTYFTLNFCKLLFLLKQGHWDLENELRVKINKNKILWDSIPINKHCHDSVDSCICCSRYVLILIHMLTTMENTAVNTIVKNITNHKGGNAMGVL